MNAHPLDPFNHGTTTVTYASVPPWKHTELADLVQVGFGLSRHDTFMEVIKVGRASRNWKVDAGAEKYLLKKSRVNTSESQSLVNRMVQELCQDGRPVPYIISTTGGDPFMERKNCMYTLYRFIDGEHFDGSEGEMQKVAEELAFLHQALALSPMRAELMERRPLVRHDRGTLLGLVQTMRAKGDVVPTYVREVLDDIDAYSKGVEGAGLDELPMQGIHGDITPHNTHFSVQGDYAATLDWDQVIYSQRIRDVAIAMHRHARTFGQLTERKNNSEGNLGDRARLFIESYDIINKSLNPDRLLTESEYAAIPELIKDDSLNKILAMMAIFADRSRSNLYYRGLSSADYVRTYFELDFKKHLTLLREADQLRF